jgi:hypothetical protein
MMIVGDDAPVWPGLTFRWRAEVAVVWNRLRVTELNMRMKKTLAFRIEAIPINHRYCSGCGMLDVD